MFRIATCERCPRVATTIRHLLDGDDIVSVTMTCDDCIVTASGDHTVRSHTL